VEKHQREIRKHPKTTRKNKINRIDLKRDPSMLSPSTAVYGKLSCLCLSTHLLQAKHRKTT
jgi:hypothetical protein